MAKAAKDTKRKERLRVVIADDTAAIRSSLSALIARVNDVEIIGLAETGTEALELARTLKPDVMTLDIRMPGMNGIKVLEAIKREKLPVTVIMLTGLVEEEYRDKCLALGASHFFHKATQFEEVINILKLRAQRLDLPGQSDPATT